MNVHATAPTDPDAFLRWNEGREGKRELVRGKVVEYVINVTRSHVRVVTRLLFELTSKLDPARFEAYAVDIGLKTPDGVRYPDIVVDLANGNGKDLAVTAPVFVCEVLSPSSTTRDMVEKLGDYTKIPFVAAYLVLSQDEPRGWIWNRQGESWSGPKTIEGPEGIIDIPALGVQIELSRLYRGSSSTEAVVGIR